MRIIHVCNDYRNNNLYEHLFSLLSEQVVQTVFVPYKFKLDIKQNNKYKVIHQVCYKDIDRLFFKKKGKKLFKILNDEVNIRAHDLIHAHTLFSNGIIAYMSKLQYGIDYVISVRNVDIDFFMKKFIHLRKKGIEILVNARKIIFISPMLKKKLFTYITDNHTKEMIEQKSIIIPNGIDNFWFENKNTNQKKRDNELSILQVGWIGHNKNQMNSIKAIEILNSKNIPCKIDIVGGVANDKDQKYYNKLLKYINASKYKDKVRVFDRKSKSELLNYYRSSQIFLMPSYSETFGLVYIEAMSQGLPILYSRNQSVDKLFDNAPVGASIDPSDPNDIAEKILYLQDNYTTLSNNIDLHLNNFKWEVIVDKFINNIY